MEDELRLVTDLPGGFSLAAVFDGHGGDLAAQWLQQELHTRLAPHVGPALLQPDPAAEVVSVQTGLRRPGTASTMFEQVFQSTDADLLKYLHAEKGAVTGASGATCTVCLVHASKLIVASIGDSSAVLCRNGQPLQLTVAHRVYGTGEAVIGEMRRVESVGGWIKEGRVCSILAVSRAFGDWEFKGEGLQTLLAEGQVKGMWTPEFAANAKFTGDPVCVVPDVREVDTTPQDEFLLIATDGLWDCMPPLEAVRFSRLQFKAGRSAQEVADMLTDVAVKRYTSDNVAIIVVDMKGDAWQGTKKKAAGGNGSLLGGLFKR